MSERKYMTLKDVKLKQPLASVKRAAENGTDALIMPKEFLNTAIGFFLAAGIEYQAVKDTSGYPEDEIKAGLERYREITGSDDYDSPPGVILVSQFDADALFEWMKQIFGTRRDPSLEQYLADRADFAEECYWTHDEGPQIYASTSFDSGEEIEGWIEETLMEPNNMQRLSEWLSDDAVDEIEFEYTAWEPGRYTGRGIYANPKNRRIAEYVSKTVNVRLVKDDSTPTGFALITAFPEIDEQAVPTGRDISADLHKTSAYRDADLVQQLIYDSMCSLDNGNGSAS